MNGIPLKNYFGLVAFATSLLFSCEDTTATLNEINRFRDAPVGIAANIRMVYTDSLQTVAILTAPKHVDYSNRTFPFAEFPEGLQVVFYDENKNENTLTAEYGILYNATKIIDLQKNVQLQSASGAVLKTSQMYWDAGAEWLFTEQDFSFVDQDFNINARRLDTNKEFSNFQTGSLTGTIAVSENDSIAKQ
jgi:LPS export ABC transporter protein LptC